MASQSITAASPFNSCRILGLSLAHDFVQMALHLMF